MESIGGFATNLNVEFSQYPISSFCSSFYVWGRNISEIVPWLTGLLSLFSLVD